MFKNVGNKIQSFAKFVFIFGTIVAAIAAIVFILAAIGAGEPALTTIYIIYGLMVLILGPIMSWINALFIYGFGQLIVNTDKTND